MSPEVTTLPRPFYLELIDEHRTLAQANRRRAALLLAVPSVAGLAVGTGASIAFAPVWLAVAIGAVLAVAASILARAAAPGAVLRRLGAEPVPTGGTPVRVANMLEGLSLMVGVERPAVLTVDCPVVEAMAVGLDEARAALVVTTGLVESLDTMEMEAMLAHALIRIKDGVTAPATLAVTTLVPLARVAPPLARALWARCGPERREETDLRTARVTHYPPALISALAKVGASGAPLPGGAAVAHLWTVPPEGAAALRAPGVPLDARCQVLEEL